MSADDNEMASADKDHEEIYSIIVDSTVELRTNMETDPTYAHYNFVVTNRPTSATTTTAGSCSRQRVLLVLVVVLLVLFLVSGSVVVTVYVIKPEALQAPFQNDSLTTPPVSTPPPTSPTTTPQVTPKTSTSVGITTLKTAVDTTTPKTSTSIDTTTPKTSTSIDTTTPKTSTSIDTTTPKTSTSIDTTTPKTSTSISTTTPKPSTVTTPKLVSSTKPPGDCSATKLCHACTSRENHGRCLANGTLNTVPYGMTMTCSTACFSEVRAADSNYVYRGCLSTQGRAVTDASLHSVDGCFKVENYIGAGLSTYCICCGELCNTHDMTKYGGKNCKPPTYC